MSREGATQLLAILQNEFSIFHQQLNSCGKSEIFWKRAHLSLTLVQPMFDILWRVPIEKQILANISTAKLTFFACTNLGMGQPSPYWQTKNRKNIGQRSSSDPTLPPLELARILALPSYPLLSIHICRAHPSLATPLILHTTPAFEDSTVCSLAMAMMTIIYVGKCSFFGGMQITYSGRISVIFLKILPCWPNFKYLYLRFGKHTFFEENLTTDEIWVLFALLDVKIQTLIRELSQFFWWC